VLVTIEAFQGDLAVVEHVIEQDARGQPPVKRQKRTIQHAAAEAPTSFVRGSSRRP